MDLHGNVSERLAANTDLITCYRMAPHEDAMETKNVPFDNCWKGLKAERANPLTKPGYLYRCYYREKKPALRIEPAKTLYKAVAPAAAVPGIIDAAMWGGYAWADEPRNHAVVMVTGDDKPTVTHTENSWHVVFGRPVQAFLLWHRPVL